MLTTLPPLPPLPPLLRFPPLPLQVPELNVQNGVLKALSFLFEYIGEMGKDYIYAGGYCWHCTAGSVPLVLPVVMAMVAGARQQRPLSPGCPT